MAINLEPIYSIVLALIIFSESEHMNLSFYIGASVIILVVFLESYLKIKLNHEICKTYYENFLFTIFTLSFSSLQKDIK